MPIINNLTPRAASMPITSSQSHPLGLIVMGVAGCGKTETSHAIADALQLECIEGDSFHSPSNLAKMSAGIPLTDEDRWSWLDALVAEGQRVQNQNRGFVIACSALRRIYRDRLRNGLKDVRFVFLSAPLEVILARVASRVDHFMPVSLVHSQFATLEAPHSIDEQDVLEVDATQAMDAVVHDAVTWARSL
jgi:gluconokinase